MSQISEPLSRAHNRADFSSGNAMLDRYLQEQASQDVKRKLSTCFVVRDAGPNLIKGYYTLSNNSIPLEHFPDLIQKKLTPSYTSIPTTLLGRLAIDTRYQGQGLGQHLLLDALSRSFETARAIGSFAVVVDPIDANAERFYAKYGFIALPDSGKMILPMNTVNHLFE